MILQLPSSGSLCPLRGRAFHTLSEAAAKDTPFRKRKMGPPDSNVTPKRSWRKAPPFKRRRVERPTASSVEMPLDQSRTFDVWFDLLLPLALGALWLALTYSVERAIFAGRPITPFLKSFNLYGGLFVVGLVYSMSVTACSWGFPGKHYGSPYRLGYFCLYCLLCGDSRKPTLALNDKVTKCG